MIRPDDEELTIKTGGKTLGGWTRLRVTRGVELLPSHFEVELTERYPGSFSQVVVKPTATCQVYLSGDLIMTGYIDRYQPVYDKNSHRVRIIGRSKTEDLVDSAIDVTVSGINTWHLTVATIGEAAKIICKPYNISVSLPDGDAPLPVDSKAFAIYPGFTGYGLLEEMARATGMLLWDDEKGQLVISKGGTGGRAGSALVEGINAEHVEGNLTADQRFAKYLVVGTGPSQAFGQINYSAIDFDPEASTLRGRLKIIPFELPSSLQYQQLRATWGSQSPLWPWKARPGNGDRLARWRWQVVDAEHGG
jgi:prophage tail gpP-like protein